MLANLPRLLLLTALFLAGLSAIPSAAQSPAAQQPAAAAQPDQPGPRQAYRLPPAKLVKAIALSRIRNILNIAGSLWAIAVLWLLLATRIAARFEACLARFTSRRWLQGLLFFGGGYLVTTLAMLPLDIYGHHAERSYQISVQGWASWFGDMGKGLALALVIGAPLLLFFNWIVRRWPRRYWVGAWIVTLPLLAILVFVAPYVAALYDKFEPLSLHHAELVSKLDQVVARTGIDIPPERMYLMKASAKTNGPNAYVTGLGASKRYVMWDTVTDRMPDDEVLFVFGHESGHYVLHHLPKGIAITAAALFFLYWACSAVAAGLVRRNGSRWGAGDLASRTGFVVLLLTVSIAGFLFQPLSNGISRHFEHQADVYGQEAIHGLVPDPQKTAVATFNDLGEGWLDDPNPNPLIEFWLYGHPSTQHRAEFAQHYDPWANGGRGEFFPK
jgi:Zn-dependent protease with chaperone function